ncbi:MAG: ATP-binding protein [Bacteroidales bacterium]|nr:ATP-binding protein [Bacteroidales bacterium]
MKIDLSGPLYDALKKTTAEYHQLKSKNDIEGSREKAGEIAILNQELAKINVSRRKELGEQARRWDAVSKGKTQKTSAKDTLSPGMTKNNSETEEEREDLLQKANSLITSSKVTWSDIGGLDSVKQLMMETVVIAGLQKPESIKPWKGILLFGPPGTGKTLLAAASAGSLDATFYDVKSESVLSKYFGESSKLISALYNSARKNAPSIVFTDEFDALSQSRDGETSEATRKVLSSLLSELDGLADKKSDQLLLTLAATNTPWDLDTAVLSRFPRRIYVPLPDQKACKEIIRIQTKGMNISGVSLDRISEKCVEMLYSGRDLSNFCQQAIWTMIRKVNPDLYKMAELPFEELKRRSLETIPLVDDDFREAFMKIRSPMTKIMLERYEQWNIQCGEM